MSTTIVGIDIEVAEGSRVEEVSCDDNKFKLPVDDTNKSLIYIHANSSTTTDVDVSQVSLSRNAITFVGTPVLANFYGTHITNVHEIRSIKEVLILSARFFF